MSGCVCVCVCCKHETWHYVSTQTKRKQKILPDGNEAFGLWQSLMVSERGFIPRRCWILDSDWSEGVGSFS